MTTHSNQSVQINTGTSIQSNISALATASTSAPCQFQEGNGLTIYGLSLSTAQGHVLFQSSEDSHISLNCGTITGLVGTNGAGKTTLAHILSSKSLDGFPQTLSVEYLAAADDEDGYNDSLSADVGDNGVSTSLQMSPRSYVQSRMKKRLLDIQQKIGDLEDILGETANSSQSNEDIEDIAQELSVLYETEDTLNENMERELDESMKTLGFEHHSHKTLEQLSCGWRYRCRLIASIMTRPSFLIIDEPSFLDTSSLKWMMGQLRDLADTQKAIVLLISHKEQLLGDLCDRILHLNSANQTLKLYHCDYMTFRRTLESTIQQSSKKVHDTEETMQNVNKSLKQLQATCKKREKNLSKKTQQGEDLRFIRGKNKEAKQKADRSLASKLKKAQRDAKDAEALKLSAKRERIKPIIIEGMPASSDMLVSLQDVGFQYQCGDEDWAFQNVDTTVDANDRILLQGPNGCGKSTLLKLILGDLEPSEGQIQLHTSNIVYFPQTALFQLMKKQGSKTALELIQSTKSMTDTDARTHLGDLGLVKDSVFRRIDTLSAGQRIRLWLSHELLIHPKPSLLIFDEMSENVDIDTRQSLTDMLSSFEGAVIIVSHDPDFCESYSWNKRWTLSRHRMHVEHR